jgi:hypothetical protein
MCPVQPRLIRHAPMEPNSGQALLNGMTTGHGRARLHGRDFYGGLIMSAGSVWSAVRGWFAQRLGKGSPTSGRPPSDPPTSNLKAQPAAPYISRNSGTGSLLSKVRTFFADSSCGFARSKESEIIPGPGNKFSVDQALRIVSKEGNKKGRENLEYTFIKGSYNLASGIKHATDAAGGDCQTAIKEIARPFKDLQACGASLEEVHAHGEFDINDEEALNFLETLARSESRAGGSSSGEDVAKGEHVSKGVDLSKVVLKGTADISDRDAQARLKRAARLGVQVNKVQLHGHIKNVDAAREAAKALKCVTDAKRIPPSLKGVVLALAHVETADVNALAEPVTVLQYLVKKGARLNYLQFIGTITPDGSDQCKQALQSILDLADNKKDMVNLRELKLQATPGVVDDREMSTRLQRALKHGAQVAIEGEVPVDDSAKVVRQLEAVDALQTKGATLQSMRFAGTLQIDGADVDGYGALTMILHRDLAPKKNPAVKSPNVNIARLSVETTFYTLEYGITGTWRELQSALRRGVPVKITGDVGSLSTVHDEWKLRCLVNLSHLGADITEVTCTVNGGRTWSDPELLPRLRALKSKCRLTIQ